MTDKYRVMVAIMISRGKPEKFCILFGIQDYKVQNPIILNVIYNHDNSLEMIKLAFYITSNFLAARLLEN
jgi:hypothetical protein